MHPTVCLIVDNPLRDLDGLVLLAFELAHRGVDAVLVPMYEQLFDVVALEPDLVLVNYIRANNRDAVRLYRERGIRVGVLDTEGAGGKSADDFARLVQATIAGTDVELYCVWGEGQFDALRARNVLPGHVLRLTGVPRYDWCASPWRNALAPVDAPGYVLINTNFPTVNPKFSRGPDEERAAMLKAGFTAEFAEAYVASAKRALAGMLELFGRIVRARPGLRFVLRPHPFESPAAYASLESTGSLRVIQSGTSLQWLAGCSVLLHMNCSTALEAVMLGREPLTPQWLNDETLVVPAAQQVSRSARDEGELLQLLDRAVTGALPAPEAPLAAARDRHLREPYFRIDGRSSARVADAILQTIATTPRPSGAAPVSAKARALHGLRRGLGHRAFGALRAAWPWRRRSAAVAASKSIRLDAVRELIARLVEIAPASVQVTPVAEGRQFSAQSVRVSPVGVSKVKQAG